MRIAIVEDDVSQADLVRIWLVGAGHACHTFSRGREFMRVMTRDSFDLLVLDLNLPDVAGETIAAEFAGRLPIVMLTAKSGEADRIRAHRAGDERVVAGTDGALRLRVQPLPRR